MNGLRRYSRQKREIRQQDQIKTKQTANETDKKWQNMLHLAMKERMWLERQLAFLTQSLQQTTEVDVNKYVQLSQNNQLLSQQVEFLKNVEKKLKEKDEECQKLEQNLSEQSRVCEKLVYELEKASTANLELSIRNIETREELQRLQQQLKDADEQQKQLEREHDNVLAQLQEKQDEIKKLRWSKEGEKKKSAESIETMESKLRELEKKCELQKVRHEELLLEMDSLRRIQNKEEAAKKELARSTIVSNGLTSEEDGDGKSTSEVVNNGPLGGGRTTPKGGGVVIEATVSEIDRIMAKLEQDNKILAELDRTRASIGLSSVNVTAPANASSSSSSLPKALNEFSSSFSSKVAVVTAAETAAAAVTTTSVPTARAHHNPITTTTPMAASTSAALNNVVTFSSVGTNVPTIITTLADHDVARTVHHESSQVNLVSNEDLSGYIDLPAFGKVQVFVARYTYDPLQHSPNENPEAELAVVAGDHVLVKGTMDEDGFFDGHLLDGRRGLVPSNFIEKLTGEDLVEFYQNFVYGLQDSDESMTSLPTDFNLDGLIDDNQMLIENCLPGDVLCLSNLDNIDEGDEFINETNCDGQDVFFSALVPPPQNLKVERQFHKSILISWTAPNATTGTLESFNVYVDGELRITVLATERTRALVEGVESLRPHRLSVRSVTPNRRMSVDAACTMIIGKGVPVAPSCVRASNITSTTAIISWLPSNSNLQHVVCVNSVEVRMLKPGIYRHTITGLSPNTTYRVTVRVKNIKSPYTDEKSAGRLETSSTSVDFRTLPKGLPDPPLDVQVEPGPQDGTLLVTWLPVTINTMGTSNGSQVTGYAVYTDGKKVADIDSPTGDHALLEISKLHSLTPKHVTVRTKSGESVSPDSAQVPIAPTRHDATKPAKTKTKKKVQEEEYHEESSERSELSDIAEEVEDDVGGGQHAVDGKKKGQRKVSESVGVKSERSASKRGGGGGGDVTKGRRDTEKTHVVKTTTVTTTAAARTSHASDRRSGGGRRHDSMGQTVIEPEENLSDKEIYPSSHMAIPAIEITKDSASEGRNSMDYSDEEYDTMHRDGRGAREKRVGGGTGFVSSSSGRKQMGHDTSGGHHHHHHGGHHPQHRDPHPHPPREQHRVRTFVALFDYDPKTMSPNPGAAMEELPFREGQLIKIYGDKDPDGFYWGEATGRQGFVPCNMVSQVQGDEETTTQSRRAVPPPRRTDPSSSQRPAAATYSRGKFSGRERWSDGYEGLPVKKMVALYDYDPQELSPNVDAEVELSFNTGDIIYVYGDMDEDGFFMGEMNGVRGLVPSNFLTEAPADYSEERRSRHSDDHRVSSSSSRERERERERDGGGGGGVRSDTTKTYDSHGMDRRTAHMDSNKYNHTRSQSQRW